MTKEICIGKNENDDELALYYSAGRDCADLRSNGSCLFPTKSNECTDSEKAYCERKALSQEPPLDINNPSEYVWRAGQGCP